jgi:hypothetical protein
METFHVFFSVDDSQTAICFVFGFSIDEVVANERANLISESWQQDFFGSRIFRTANCKPVVSVSIRLDTGRFSYNMIRPRRKKAIHMAVDNKKNRTLPSDEHGRQ